MKKVFAILMLLVSMQMFSTNLEAKALELQDEITYCIDIDVGEVLIVEILSLHSTQTVIMHTYGSAICNRDMELAQINWRNTERSFDISKIPKSHISYKDVIPDLLNGSSGGLADRQSLTT